MKWHKPFNRPYSLQKDQMCIGQWYSNNNFFNISKIIFVPYGNDKADYYFIKNEWDKHMQELIREPFNDSNFLYKHLRSYKKTKARLIKYSRILKRLALNRASDRSLLAAYIKYYREYLRYDYYFFLPWSINVHMDPWLKKELRKKYPDDYLRYYNALTSVTRDSVFTQQYKKLLKYKIEGDLKRKIGDHVTKYGWYPVYNYEYKPWNKNDFLKQLTGIKDPKKELGKLNTALRQNKLNYTNTIKAISNNKKLVRIAKIVHEYVYLRDDRIDVFKMVLYTAQPFYRELERRWKLPKYSSMHLTIKEIEEKLSGEKGFVMEELAARLKNKYICYYQGENPTVISDKKEIQYIKEKILQLKDYRNLKSCKGMTACTGKKNGRVRIIMSQKDVKKMKVGEILVSNMTHPDYMVAIKKASAIVTDEGGVTCHAAIISRELQTPCIIGTKIVTEVFKDGDMVEVNANNGIIRKI